MSLRSLRLQLSNQHRRRLLFESLENRNLLAPVAVGDNYTLVEDAPLVVGAAGVLANDTNAATAVLATAPIHGTLQLSASGSFTYTPASNYFGSDQFTYRASDGVAASDPVAVNITVVGINDAPVAVDNVYAATANQPLVVFASGGVLANDTDADLNALTVVLVGGPSNGTLTLNPDGSFAFTPNVDSSGVNSFTYRASDGLATSNTATVTINVVGSGANVAPVSVNDTFAAVKNAPLTVAAPGILANDTDFNGDPLTAVLVTGPAHGTIALNANGTFTYGPALDYAGVDSFTYRASDGTLSSNAATVTIAVAGGTGNLAPVAVNDAFTTTKNTTLTQAAPGVLANDTDANNDVLTAALVTGPEHGTLSLSPSGSFTYVPASDYTGPDGFAYRTRDGLLTSNVGAVTITVAPPSPPASPIPAPPGLIAWWAGNGNSSDSAGSNHGIAEGGATYAAGKVGQAFSLDGLDDRIRVPNRAVLNPTAGFTIEAWIKSNTNDGPRTIVSKWNDNTSDWSFIFKDHNDSDKLRIELSKNTFHDLADLSGATALATGQWVHVAMTYDTNAVRLYYNGTLDGSQAIAPSQVIDSSTTDLLIGAAFTGGGTSEHFSGLIDELSLYSRALSSTEIQAIVAAGSSGKQATQPAPVATDDSYTGVKNTVLSIPAPGVLANDTHSNGDLLTATLVTGPAHGTLTLAANGGMTYVPAANYTGPDGFSYSAQDSRQAVSNVADVAVSVRDSIAPSGLIGWWTGDDTAADFSGQMNHGILEGGAAFAPGIVGRAFSLDGIDDRIRVPHSAVLNPTDGFTIEAWIKSNSTDGARDIVSKWNDNTSDWSYIFKDHNGTDKLRVELSKSEHSDLADLSGSTSIAIGQWTHVAMTYDRSNVRLYHNGVLDGTQAVDPTRLIDRSAADLLIGAVFTGGGVGENFSGLIDEVALYDRALSAVELQAIATAGAAGKQKPLAVTSSTPAAGDVVTAAPTEFSVRLSLPYDPASVQASDLAVNGVPATSFVATDATTITFQFATSPVLAAGSQTLQIAAGAVSSSSSGAGSSALQPYSISFQYVDLSQAIPAPSGLIGWWTGDGTGADFTGNRDGILEGNVGFAPGMVGQAFSLDGIDDRIRVPNATALNPAAGFTIEAWIKSNATSGPRVIASKWNDNTSDWSYIFKDHNDSDKLRIELSKDNFHDLADLSGASSVATGQWIHVAMTYDTSIVRLYFNGMLDGSEAVDPTRFIDRSAADLLIGAVYTAGGISEFFAGQIDEVSLYSRALETTEIQSIAAAGAVGKQKALLVTGSTPAAGANFASAPTEFTIAFSHPVKPESVQTSDLRVNGIPATSMTLVNATTVKFIYSSSPALNNGLQTMEILAGAIAADVTGIALPEMAAWSRTFFVGDVNQSYSISPSLKVAAELGGQQVTAWLSDIVTGPDDQPRQSFHFLVGTNNPSLFAVSPAIDPTGRLTFTPAPNSKGIATVHVLLVRGMGAEGESGGELDTTSAGTFTIEILQLYPLQNDRDWLDVSDDLYVSPIDAVLIIDFLNGVGGGEVELNSDPGDPFMDTSGDNFISPIDAVLVINDLNGDDYTDVVAAGEAEGESASGARNLDAETTAAAVLDFSDKGGDELQLDYDELFALIINDVSLQSKRRRLL